MSFNVSFIIKAIDSFSAPMRAVKDSMASLKTKVDSLNQSLEKTGKKMRNFGAGMSVGITAPIIAAGVMAIKTAGDIESLTISFGTMLGSQEKANSLMKDLINYAAKTPFEMPQIGQAARVLLAFNVSAENILPTLTRLGDIAAGANIPMNELALIFGKVLSKGKLQAEELNQMAERGIPIMSFLEKQLGKSKAEIYKLGEQGKLSAKYVVDAFSAMTNKGGLFYQMTEKQSTSINGLISTLTDTIRLAGAEFGNIIIDTFELRTLIPQLSTKVEEFAAKVKTFAQENPFLMKMILGATAFLAIAGPLIAALGLIAISVGAIFSPAFLIAGAIMALAAAFSYFYMKSESFRKAIDEIVKALQPLIKLLSFLWDAQWGAIGKLFESANLIGSAIGGAFSKGNEQKENLNSGIMYSPAVQEITGYSSADISVNIADKNNNVSSVATRTLGNSNINVGRNMPYIR